VPQASQALFTAHGKRLTVKLSGWDASENLADDINAILAKPHCSSRFLRDK
jgi:hypothetical protein